MAVKAPAYFSNLLKSERAEVAKNLLKREKMVRSTGSVTLDWAMGGGAPVGELLMFWGPQGSGKTTMAVLLLAQELRMNPTKHAIWIDTEYSFDAKRAEALGVDLDRLLVIQSNKFDEAVAPLAKVEEDIKKDRNICAIVVDSIKGLQSINEFEQMAEGNVSSAANAYGGIAKSVNPALSILLRIANECDVLTILTNHANMNMDMKTAKYTPYTLTGGQRLKHLCSTIVFMEKVQSKDSKLNSELKDAYGNEIMIGSKIRCRVNKTRQTVEGKTSEFYWNLETGVFEKREQELFNLAKGLDIIKAEGQSFFYGDPALGIKARFESGFVKLLEKDANLSAKILQECKSCNKLTTLSEPFMLDVVDVEATEE